MTRRTRRISVALTISLVAALLSVGTFASPASAGTLLTTNSCQNNATGTFANVDFTLTGAATPNPASLGIDTVSLAGATVDAFFPGAILAAGYNLGFLSLGANTVNADIDFTLLASNTAEGTQSTGLLTIVGATTFITDPDGLPGTGDETATDLGVTVPLPTTVWTPTGGDIAFSDGGSITTAHVGLNVTFTCLPGISVNTTTDVVPGDCGLPTDPNDCTSRAASAALPFDTVSVVAPPTAPVCTGTGTSVGAGQAVVVDLNTLCSDVNGNIDAATYAVGLTAPVDGTLGIVSGVATYTNTNVTATADSFSFTVSDSSLPTPLVSNEVTVTITILGNLCDATVGGCSLNQVITVTVTGAALTLEQTNQFVTMTGVTLNGAPQASDGNLNQITVTNARGDLVGWTVSAYATDFSAPGGPFTDPDGPGALPPVPDCGFLVGAADALCIPGDNLGWTPSAAVAHVQIAGDVAAVTAGPSHAVDSTDWLAQLSAAGVAGVNGLGGLNETNMLCSAAAGVDGGTFTCDAALYLGVPASAGAGTYSGALVLTLL